MRAGRIALVAALAAALLCAVRGGADEPEDRLSKLSPKQKVELEEAFRANRLMRQAMEKGRHEEAIPHALKVAEVLGRLFGEKDANYAVLMHNLGTLYEHSNDYASAEKYHRRAQAIREQVLGRKSMEYADSLGSLGLVRSRQGSFAEAQRLLEQSLAIKKELVGDSHPRYAEALSTLGLVYLGAGELGKCEKACRQAIEIFADFELPRERSQTLTNLAICYGRMGKFDQGEATFKEALDLTARVRGKGHPDYATTLQSLAIFYSSHGKHLKAVDPMVDALAILRKTTGPTSAAYARGLNNLANLYLDARAHAEARKLLLESKAIAERVSGTRTQGYATLLSNLARTYSGPDELATGEKLYLQSLGITKGLMGTVHPDYAAGCVNLAVLYASAGRWPEAYRSLGESRRSVRSHVLRVLPGLPERDQMAYLNHSYFHSLATALSIGLERKADAQAAELTAEWLLNGKAVAQESLVQVALQLRDARSPAAARVLGELLGVRQDLARLSVQVPPPGREEAYRKQRAELTAREEELARRAEEAGATSAGADRWVRLDRARKVLLDDAVLIDVARFRVFDYRTGEEQKKGSARYAAWVTPKRGPVALVDLGPAEAIDAALRKCREGMQNTRALLRQIKEQGEEKAERALRADLEALSKLVLRPLLAHAGKAKRWLVSPDGNLWLVPFEALLLADGSYVIEKHQVGYLTSGRDLLFTAPVGLKTSAPLVLADPAFDLDPAGAKAGAKMPADGGEERTRSLSGALHLGRVQRLPGTAAEAKAIAPSLKALAGTAPQVFTQERALEGVVKAARSPRVLVLCTHGFFLPDQQAAGKQAAWSENPLLRCGLLLAGCNKAGKAADANDGVLTGLEVVGTDLRGTELVVLSACETGLGDVQSGEGVAGLRQAFQLAGAQAVVSTLWQVPDRQSARLMALFFAGLSKGQGKAEALRAAKLKLIEERRDDFAAAHPFFWAAFTLTGER
jgi:CHAT domain-containing protein/tetratricopeptide (TPR) repeat protein